MAFEPLTQPVSRRSFLKGSALASGTLVVGFFVPGGMRRLAFAQEAGTAAALCRGAHGEPPQAFAPAARCTAARMR